MFLFISFKTAGRTIACTKMTSALNDDYYERKISSFICDTFLIRKKLSTRQNAYKP